MAISGVGSTTSYRDQWENKTGVFGSDEEVEGSESSGNTEKIWNAVFTDKKENAVSTEDFLSLMVAQMTNQDFMNPMDDTQFVTQLAQFSSMQMMMEMSNYTKTSYVMSLVGKDVTAARMSVSGELLKESGPVEKVTLSNNEFGIVVNGKTFTLEQIMEIGKSSSKDDTDTTTKPIDPEEDLNRKEYLNSLIGREVTIAAKGEDANGKYDYDITGIVEKVSSKDGTYRVYVNDEWHLLDSIIEVGSKQVDDEEEDIPPVADTDKTEDDTKVEDTDKVDETDKVEDTEPTDKTDETEPTAPTDTTPEDTPPVESVPTDSIETEDTGDTTETETGSEEETIPLEEAKEV